MEQQLGLWSPRKVTRFVAGAWSLLAYFSLAVSSGGCILLTNEDDDDPCELPAPDSGEYLRNPHTGQCVAIFGYPGQGCGPQPAAAEPVMPTPPWAACGTSCEALSESECLAASDSEGAGYGCQAAYVYDEYANQQFWGCWAVAQPLYEPIQEPCGELSAEACSMRVDCSPVYAPDTVGDVKPTGNEWDEVTFFECQAAPSKQACMTDSECGTGYRCDTQNYCLPPPGCEPGEICPAVCYGMCVPQNSCEDVGACEDGSGPVETCSVDSNGVVSCECQCPPVLDCSNVLCEAGSHCEMNCDPPVPCNAPEGAACLVPPLECQPVCMPDNSCANVFCGPGTHCETVCYPCDPLQNGSGCEQACSTECVPDGPDQCAEVSCGPGQYCSVSCGFAGCDAVCLPLVPQPGACDGAIFCGQPAPACPADTVAGIYDGCYTGYCIPVSECGPQDPGSCYGDVLDIYAPPDCPPQTVPGVKDGAYTGYCIPVTACAPDIACEAMLDEATCVARPECSPVYSGTNCSCTPAGCSCESFTFSYCQTLAEPLDA